MSRMPVPSQVRGFIVTLSPQAKSICQSALMCKSFKPGHPWTSRLGPSTTIIGAWSPDALPGCSRAFWPAIQMFNSQPLSKQGITVAHPLRRRYKALAFPLPVLLRAVFIRFEHLLPLFGTSQRRLSPWRQSRSGLPCHEVRDVCQTSTTNSGVRSSRLFYPSDSRRDLHSPSPTNVPVSYQS